MNKPSFYWRRARISLISDASISQLLITIFGIGVISNGKFFMVSEIAHFMDFSPCSNHKNWFSSQSNWVEQSEEEENR